MPASRLLFLAAQLCGGFSLHATFRPPFPIEVHGFNSLGTWPQLLLKQAGYFKVDVGFATRSACETFSTFPATGQPSDCFSQGGEEYCCLALSGDTGSRPYLLDPFNTTTDLVALLSTSTQLPHGSARQPQLLIGLDFGGSPSACLTGCPGAALTRAFLTGAYAAIQARNLSVAFALDNGIVGWYSELDNACAAAGSCSASDQALAAMPWVSQSGASWRTPTTDAAAARFAILNDDVQGFQACCSSNCWQGAVAPSAHYPWLWYEQTGQQDYLTLLASWTACSTLPEARRLAPNTQLHFVSNEAPEMAEVFAAPAGVLGRGLNAPIPATAAFTTPLALAVPLAASAAADHALLLLASTPSGLTVWSLAHSGGAAPPNLTAATASARLQPPSPAAPPAAFLVAASVPGEDAATSPTAAFALLLAGVESGTVAAAGLDTASGAFSAFPGCSNSSGSSSWCEWSLQLPPGSALLSAALLCSTPPAAAAMPSSPSALSATCTVLALVGGSGAAGGALLLTYPFGASAPTAGSSPVPVAPAALRIDKGGSLAMLWQGGSGTAVFEGVAVVAARGELPLSQGSLYAQPVSSGSSSSAVPPRWDGARSYQYAVHVRVDLGSGSVSTSPAVNAQGPAPARVGLGSSPRLAGIRLQGVNRVAMVSSDGQCSEGQYVNNADMSHCLLPLPSSDSNLFYSAFQTVPYTLQYDFGSVEAWRGLAEGSAPYPHLGICSTSLTHGKFELGASGSAALFPWMVTQAGGGGGNVTALEVGVLVAHEPAPQGALTAPQWLLCGLPNTKQGLVWSNFQLVGF